MALELSVTHSGTSSITNRARESRYGKSKPHGHPAAGVWLAYQYSVFQSLSLSIFGHP
jgi:hypothetical protein